MNEKPILFSTPMVKAILAGEKTMTRRIVKEPIQSWMNNANNPEWWENIEEPLSPFRVGQTLWVREAFRWFDAMIESDQDGVYSGWQYKADELEPELYKWKPSIFMPRAASRISLLIKSVRVERLQDISGEDALSEGTGYGWQINAGWPDYLHIKNGVCELTQDDVRISFATLWESINGKGSWEKNPWVWVIKFEKI